MEGTCAGPRAPATEADDEPASTLRVPVGRGHEGPRQRRMEREAFPELLDCSPKPKGREPKGAVPSTEESKSEGARADAKGELTSERGALEEAATPEEAAAAPGEPAEPEGEAAFRAVALLAWAIAATVQPRYKNMIG